MRGRIVAKYLALLCSGCTPPLTLPGVVKVPVPIRCPAPPPLQRPLLPVESLSLAATADQYVRAVETSLELLMGYASQLEIIVDGYRSDDDGR